MHSRKAKIESLRATLGPAGQAITRGANAGAHRAIALRAPVIVDPSRTKTEQPIARPMIVRANRPVAQHPIYTPGLGFGPPGLDLRTMYTPWSRRTWLSQRPTAAPIDRQTAVRLQESPAGDGWELVIECNTPTPANKRIEQDIAPSTDLVRIWLGPYTNATGSLIVGPGAARQLTGASPPEYRVHDWGWSSVVPIPDRAIGNGGTLHLAIERIDNDGFRSTWPRPVLPDQLEPGRATILLTPWTIGPE